METKTAKITQVMEAFRNFNGQQGMIYVHAIKFEGDTENKAWEYHSKSATCDKFKVGETTTFETEIKVRGQYTDYRIKPAGDAGGKFKGTFIPRDEGLICMQSCISSAATFYSLNKMASTEDLKKLAVELYDLAMSKSTLNKQS